MIFSDHLPLPRCLCFSGDELKYYSRKGFSLKHYVILTTIIYINCPMKGDGQRNADADVGQTPELRSQLPFDKGMLEVKTLNMLFSNVN